jgi:hypothetical protein
MDLFSAMMLEELGKKEAALVHITQKTGPH